MGFEQGGTAPDSTTVARALGSLKQNGGNVLVVGTDEESHASICGRLSGESADCARHQLFVRADRSRRAVESGADRDGVDWVVAYSSGDADSSTPPSIDCRLEPAFGDGFDPADQAWQSTSRSAADASFDELTALGSEIVGAVDEFDGDQGGVAPAQLRLCVGSLEPLLTDHDAENVFRLLHVVTTRINRTNGMGHYHLPVDRKHEAVRLLEPLFDAVLEVRTWGGGIEQRWHFRDRNASSSWLPV
ncbi:DUF7504 family protein [Natronobeatus ordinarius]|uniref:DUF7504 family protein n=1 Tax=Natronobeatus ordinarius TaxID=2963433 RepID=UPI0020CE6C3E|nr:hypothetical protein [Natronobeatus ordinarius]